MKMSVLVTGCMTTARRILVNRLNGALKLVLSSARLNAPSLFYVHLLRKRLHLLRT